MAQPYNPILDGFERGVDIGGTLINNRRRAQQLEMQRQSQQLREQSLLERMAIAEMNRDAANNRASEVLKASEDRIQAGKEENDKKLSQAKDFQEQKDKLDQAKLDLLTAKTESEREDAQLKLDQQQKQFDAKMQAQKEELTQTLGAKARNLLLQEHQTNLRKSLDAELKQKQQTQQALGMLGETDSPLTALLKKQAQYHDDQITQLSQELQRPLGEEPIATPTTSVAPILGQQPSATGLQLPGSSNASPAAAAPLTGQAGANAAAPGLPLGGQPPSVRKFKVDPSGNLLDENSQPVAQ